MNKPRNSWKAICKHVGDVSGSLRRFVALTQIRPLQNHGLIGRFRTLGISYEISSNKPQNSWKSICNHVGDVSESLDDFSNLQKSALFKTMGYSPGFLVKIGRFQTLGNSYEIFTNKPQNSYKSFCKHVGDVSGSLGRFLALTEIRPLQNHGRPGVLVKIGRFQNLANSYEIFSNKPQTS